MWGRVGGSVYDDGIDEAGGGFVRSSAFTCNIVAAKIHAMREGRGLHAGLLLGCARSMDIGTYLY